MRTINISIPDEIHEMNMEYQQSLAIGLFVSKAISMAKAAQLAGKKIDEFLDVLKHLNIPAFVYTDEMLDDDAKFAERI